MIEANKRQDAQRCIAYIDCASWFGGAQRSLWTLMNGVRQHGIVPLLFSADRTRGGLLDLCRTAGIDCFPVTVHHWHTSCRGLLQFLHDRTRFINHSWNSLARQQGIPPVAMLHANSTRAALLCSSLASAERPLIVHARDVREPGIVRRLVRRQAGRIIAVSETVARLWEKNDGAEKIRIVHNGFDTNAISDVTPQPVPWHDEPDAFTVIMVADFVAWKRHELFLKTVAAARRWIPSLHALLVGRTLDTQGEKRLRYLQKKAAGLGLDEHALSIVTNAPNALPWIAASDVLVSTADREPFGRTVVEALACGKPVVTVKGGGPEEILKNCAAGCVVTDEPEILARAVAEFCDRLSLAEIAETARTCARNFSEERMITGILKAYSEVVP